MEIQQATKLNDLTEREQKEMLFLLLTAIRKDDKFFEIVKHILPFEGIYCVDEGFVNSHQVDNSILPRVSPKVEEGFTEINIEQFRKITNMKKEKSYYHFKKGFEKYGEIAAKISGLLNADEVLANLKVFPNGSTKFSLEEAGVLNLWFEEVTEPTQVVLYVGDKKTEVKIGKGYIHADGKKFDIVAVRNICEKLSVLNRTTLSSLEIHTFVKIGCTTLSYNDVLSIVTTYDNLNK
jgi:hypothetical protein